MAGDLLRLVGVSKGYARGDQRLHVLRDASLEIAPREIAAVVGSRYEGKSTLLRVAAGLEQPDEGEVWFEQRELTRASGSERAELRSGIAWVHRGGSAVRLLQVIDYVGLPLATGRGRGKREVRELAAAALARTGVSGCARQRWADLSNWERVLVALARGIVARPGLMVIDDLLDGLGPRRTQEASELLASLVEELSCGVLMSVSDIEGALAADSVLTFERGRLKWIAEASDADIIDFPGESRGGRGVTGAG
ncbi:MAG TPA: ATP-binding cassette domain-containing protein [Solirubrobacteraceae bacterium]|nr:ATP-binding cassette domain-containing protein [Solirubrobacteraceae bacterium]